MTRLPIPGSDDGSWGDILNDFLSVEHNADGTLKSTGTIATKADNTTVVHLAGTETITGSKTFSASPIVPTPTNPTDGASKGYVDTAISGVGAGAVSFKTTYYDIPNGYGSTSWFFTPLNSDGTAVGGIPYFGGYNQSGTGTGVEELSYSIMIQAGTWSFFAYHLLGPNTGNFTVLVDGTESASIDTYAASYTHVITPTLAGTALPTGIHTFTIRKKGTKNVASSDFYILWSGLMGVRTGP